MIAFHNDDAFNASWELEKRFVRDARLPFVMRIPETFENSGKYVVRRCEMYTLGKLKLRSISNFL